MNDETLMELLIRHEGKRTKAYDDKNPGEPLRPGYTLKGWATVGIGHNLAVPLSEAAIQQIFRDDVNEAINECLHTFPWFADLTERRQWAMVSIRFNLGLKGLLGFPKFLKAMSLGEYETAANELLDSEAGRALKPRYTELANMIRGAEQT